jgi:hypothetical protein
VNATTTKPQLPTWATWRCDWCGEPMWDGSLSWTPHGRTERLHTHGYDRAACDLPTEYVLAHQALIEASEQIGRFIAESDEEQYEDPKTLQAVLWAVQSTLDRGHEGMRHYDVERAS